MSDFSVGAANRPTPQSTDAKLRQATQAMEGSFVQQLFKAMRETVPEGGLIDGGSGEDMFSSLMDQHLAAEAPSQWDRGIGASLYRQFRGAIAGPESPTTPSVEPDHES
ncbi:MAG TPA: rod-binding protein [Longimicrobiaceae bacterium]|nr:rod-binding protein [Longimicrobiaceae bacterium]